MVGEVWSLSQVVRDQPGQQELELLEMPGLLALSSGHCCFYPRHLSYSNKSVLEVLTQSHITPIIFFTSTLQLLSSNGKNHANTQTDYHQGPVLFSP